MKDEYCANVVVAAFGSTMLLLAEVTRPLSTHSVGIVELWIWL